MQYYINDRNEIAFFNQCSTPDFWDHHWSQEINFKTLEKSLKRSNNHGYFISAVKKYLPANSTILEGGCGQGRIVYSLFYNKYKAIYVAMMFLSMIYDMFCIIFFV